MPQKNEQINKRMQTFIFKSYINSSGKKADLTILSQQDYK
jgi:hypothetical protein